MRPDLQDEQARRRYRRERSNSSTNSLRIAIILTVSIGIVAAAFVLTNIYEFNSVFDPTITPSAKNDSSDRPSGGSNRDTADLISPDGPNNSSTTNNSSDPTNGSSDSPNGSTSTNDPLVNADTQQESSTITAGCIVRGRVTDDWGGSMASVHVFATTADGTVISTTTDSRGRYTLPESTPDAVSMSVSLAHMNDNTESFAVKVGNDVITLTTPIDPESSGCEVNFDSWNVEDQMFAFPIDAKLWPDAATIYQYTLNAESLAINLGAEFDDAAPLEIQAWCEDPTLGCDASQDGAYFIAAGELDESSPPTIVMLPSRSSDNSPGIPDNREYHEYGHYFLSLKTGDNFELPAGDRNHGGYYNNSSTRDSYVEGFAEFYSMMVSRHIDNDENAEIYAIGADYDLEADRLPWEAAGWWEEFTVAGLLLDLVDGDSDYAVNDATVAGVNILDVTTDVDPSGTIISGSVVNTSPLVIRNADITVRYLNDTGEVVGTQVTRVLPQIIAPTREGTFFAAPPAGLDITTATATLGGLPKSDDDNMDIGLLRLIEIITTYERSDGSNGVSNVAELYDSLTATNQSQVTGGANLADISKTEVDEIFVSHGFFADLDGNKIYDPELDGEIGASSHPVTNLGGETFPAFLTRHDPDPYEGSFVKINTGDADVDAIIQISMPADGGSGSYAYVAPKDGSDQIELAVPAANQQAEVTIITAGKGYRPVIAFRVQADNFHEKVENGTISELQVDPVELAPGSSLEQPVANGTAIQLGVMIGGVFAVLLVVASLIAIRRQWGKA